MVCVDSNMGLRRIRETAKLIRFEPYPPFLGVTNVQDAIDQAAPSQSPTFYGTVTVNGSQTINTAPGVGNALTIVGNSTGDPSQGSQIELTNTNAASGVQSKFLRVSSAGYFQLLNTAYSASLFTVTDAGVATIIGQLAVNGGPSGGRALDAYVQNFATGYQEMGNYACWNDSGKSTYTRMTFLQNNANIGCIEVANQANTKGTLSLQPFGGTVLAPTVTPSTDSSTKVASTAFVQNAIAIVSAGVTNITAGTGLTGGGSGNVTLAVATNGITNALAAQMLPNTIKGNNTAGLANAADLTPAQAWAVIGSGVLSNSNPVMDGTAAPGTGTTVARADHVHPSDTSRAAQTNPVIGGSIYLTSVNGGEELGSTTTANTPYIDFHSSGNNIDYDARFLATGGTATVGTGALQFIGQSLTVSGLANSLTAQCPYSAYSLVLQDTTSGSKKNFRVNSSGTLEIVNSANTAVRYTLDDSGNFNAAALCSGGTVVAYGNLWSEAAANSGVCFLGSNGSHYLQFDGSNYNLGGGGALYAPGPVVANNWVCAGNSGSNTTYYFGPTGNNHYLNYDGTNTTLLGGGFINTGYLMSNVASNQGILYLGGNAAAYLQFDGSNMNLYGGPLVCGSYVYSLGGIYYVRASGSGNAHLWFQNNAAGTAGIFYWEAATGNMHWQNSAGKSIDLLTNGALQGNYGWICRAGIPGGNRTNVFNIDYPGLNLWIDNSNMGAITTSDYRTKKDVKPLKRTWEIIKKLRPISYKHKDFTPLVEKRTGNYEDKAFFPGDDIERWGFPAHELQEALCEGAATGHKDADNVIQSPNPMAVIAALTKALQEAMERIEALEARAA